jgi:hypothetical protein
MGRVDLALPLAVSALLAGLSVLYVAPPHCAEAAGPLPTVTPRSGAPGRRLSR